MSDEPNSMREMTYAEALVDALVFSLESDASVTLIGGYMLGLGPERQYFDQIRERFPQRLIDPPVAEAAIAGIATGAAMAGMRPFVSIGTASFLFPAWELVVNEAANAHYMTNGQINVPVVFHMLHGIRGGGAAQHSHSPQAMLSNCPGLEIVLPASPKDAKGLLRTAIDSNNPTVFLDHAKLLGTSAPVPEEDYRIPFGQADIKREGTDITVVASSHMVLKSLEAADLLASDGISVEVVDLRTLVPLDKAAVLNSVAKTGRLVVVDECNLNCSTASEISAIVAEEAFDSLQAPIARVARLNAPVAASPLLEGFITPGSGDIVNAVRKVLR